MNYVMENKNEEKREKELFHGMKEDDGIRV